MDRSLFHLWQLFWSAGLLFTVLTTISITKAFIGRHYPISLPSAIWLACQTLNVHHMDTEILKNNITFILQILWFDVLQFRRERANVPCSIKVQRLCSLLHTIIPNRICYDPFISHLQIPRQRPTRRCLASRHFTDGIPATLNAQRHCTSASSCWCGCEQLAVIAVRCSLLDARV